MQECKICFTKKYIICEKHSHIDIYPGYTAYKKQYFSLAGIQM